MGGFFGTVAKASCVADLFYGTDYNSHLGYKTWWTWLLTDQEEAVFIALYSQSGKYLFPNQV